MSDRWFFKIAIVIVSTVFIVVTPAHAQSNAATAPYDEQLNRLAEVLGSVHYLTNLCSEPTNVWRDQMQTMLATETPAPNRRARLIASFNRGFRSFDSVYTTCTAPARQARERYLAEGRALSSAIAARYGQ